MLLAPGGALRALVDEQCGVVHTEQLSFYGFNRMAQHRLRRELGWRRILPRVFVVESARAEDQYWQRLRAALLVVPQSVVSHRAAAMLYGFEGVVFAPVELTSGRRHRWNRWLTVHRSLWLSEADVVIIDGMRVTSVVRTLVDLAAVVTEDKLAYAVDSAWRTGRVTPVELRDYLREHRSSGMDGIAKLEAVLDDCEQRGRPFASYFELKMWRIILRENLPRPIIQAHFRDEVGNLYPDFAFFEHGVVLEMDGAETHTSEKDVERDERRTVRLTRGGWAVMRFRYKMMKHREKRCVQLLREALELRSGLYPPVSLEADALGFDHAQLSAAKNSTREPFQEFDGPDPFTKTQLDEARRKGWRPPKPPEGTPSGSPPERRARTADGAGPRSNGVPAPAE